MVTKAEMSAIGPTAAQDGRSILVSLVSLHGLYPFLIRGQDPVSNQRFPPFWSCPARLKDLDLHGPKPLCFVFPQEALEGMVAAAGGRGECPSVGRVVGIQQAVASLGVLRWRQ